MLRPRSVVDTTQPIDLLVQVLEYPEAPPLDEPLTALDASLRERLRIEINGLLRGLGMGP